MSESDLPEVPGVQFGNFMFVRSMDPQAPAGAWEAVLPEDVPDDLKDPDVLGRLVANPGWMAAPRGDQTYHYMVLRMPAKSAPEDHDANQCPQCGAEWVWCEEGFGQTLVGYASPPGHDHDDNCRQKQYRCANGHEHALSIRRRCSTYGCDWAGKSDCFCHPGRKVDAWPEVSSR